MNPGPCGRKRRKNAQIAGGNAPAPFANWTEDHPFYKGVRNWIMDRVSCFSDPAIFIIVGPTGAGKSTMIQHLEATLVKTMGPAMEADPSLIPYLSAEATYTPGVGLDWATLFEDLLESGYDLLIDRKVEEPSMTPGSRLRSLQRAVNHLMLYRSPALGIIDESSAFVEGSGRRGLETNLNYLKSLGNRSRTHLAFFGDYRLADLVKYSGQLNRRCYFAHFPPYPSSAYKQFYKVVESFEKRMLSLRIDCELLSSAELLFDRSCGCVGLLQRWLQDAWVDARRTGVQLGHALIATKSPSDAVLLKWRTEIASGAIKMNDLFSTQKDLFRPDSSE